MKRFACCVMVVLGFSAIGTSPLVAGSDPHAYFNSLLSRSDVWKSYTLRDQAQLDAYTSGAKPNDWVTYNPAADTNPHKQDAAKVDIPAFNKLVVRSHLATGIDGAQTVIPLSTVDTEFYAGRAMLVDKEAMKITAVDTTALTATVTRGYAGTAAAAHAASSVVYLNTNSLQKQIRLPLGTENGHTYFFTWDAYWTDSFIHWLPTEHKAFQLSSGGDKIWLETQVRYDGEYATGFSSTSDVASVTMRGYMGLGGNADYSLTPGYFGPGVTKRDPILPKVGSFVVQPNTWTRFWVRIQQNGNDYSPMDMWVADARHPATAMYTQIPVSPWKGSIDRFWLEFDTSWDRYSRGDTRDVVAYVRNFVALIDPGDITPLLQPPSDAAAPLPPQNVHIVR